MIDPALLDAGPRVLSWPELLLIVALLAELGGAVALTLWFAIFDRRRR